MIKWEKMCWLWIWNKKRRREWRDEYRKCTHYYGRYIYGGQVGSDIISKVLNTGRPCMVMRFAGQEFYTSSCLFDQRDKKRVVFPEKTKRDICNLSGFFPNNDSFLTRFSSELLNNILPQADVIALWKPKGERDIIQTYNKTATLVDFDALGPNVESPSWTACLAGRKVLVIHPFAKTIESQYKKRKVLFRDSRILPDFELKTLRAIQGLGGLDNGRFSNWFEALNFMCRQIDQIDFDIALIGAGAYGMFLAQYVKQIGKQSVHTAGATQLLFGIKGHRWLHEQPEFAQRIFNEHWVFPLPEETPVTLDAIMRAEDCRCYW